MKTSVLWLFVATILLYAICAKCTHDDPFDERHAAEYNRLAKRAADIQQALEAEDLQKVQRDALRAEYIEIDKRLKEMTGPVAPAYYQGL